jgi:SAM-dependent methyltransferase
MTYDADRVRGWYAEFNEREWDRLDATLLGRIRYAIHRRVLMDVVEPGMQVADVGCGPGRFAIDLIEAGADVTLVDLSPAMLEQARQRLTEAGVEAADIVEADVRDLATFEDGTFDLVVCYGGAVSYCYDEHERALAELARIAAPGAPLLVSVMTLVGMMRLLGSLDAASVLEDWPEHMPEVDWDADGAVLTRDSPEWHLPLALFTPEGLAEALSSVGCEVERFAVSNPLTMLGQELEQITASEAASQRLIDLEVALSERPGFRDSGEHLIALARKRS